MSGLSSTSDLTVEHLARHEIRLVYPLMRQLEPSLSLAYWLRYGRHLGTSAKPARSGILVARREALPHVSGAVCYTRSRDLRHGWLLTAEHFIAMDLLHPDEVLAALLAALEVVASAQGCSAIRSIIPGAGGDLLVGLQRCGHRADGVTLSKLCIRGDPDPSSG